ncbi:MAG: hypothetical protein AAGE52_01690 [Myxococcota bacterium]
MAEVELPASASALRTAIRQAQGSLGVTGDTALFHLATLADVLDATFRPPLEVRLRHSLSVATLRRWEDAVSGVVMLSAAGHRVILETIELPGVRGADTLEALRGLLALERAGMNVRGARLTITSSSALDVAIAQGILRDVGWEDLAPQSARDLNAGVSREGLSLRVVDAGMATLVDRVREIGMRAGHKPVWRLTVPADQQDRERERLRAIFGAELVMENASHTRAEEGSDLAIGFDAAQVRELSALMDEPTTDAVRVRTGELLGYPSCCVESFASGEAWEEDFIEKAAMLRRAEGPERLPTEWIPWLILHDFLLPCSFSCDASQTRASELMDALTRAGVEAPPGGWERLVFFALFDWPGNVAVLLRGEDAEGGFHYQPAGASQGQGRLAPLLMGDRLSVDANCVTVYAGTKALHTYVGAGVLDATEVRSRDWLRAYKRVLDAAAPAPLPDEDSVLATLASFDVHPPLRVRKREVGHPQGGGAARERIVFDDQGASVTLVPAAGIPWVLPVLAPGPRAWLHRAFVRRLAKSLAPVSVETSPDAEEAFALACVAAHPLSGERRIFSGFAASWPIRVGLETRIALVRGDRVLELTLAPTPERAMARVAKWGISYRGEGAKTPRERSAIQRFVAAIRDAVKASGMSPRG